MSSSSDVYRTKFLELEPRSAASGIGVLVVPGAGWGASALREAAAVLTEAGHAVVLCDPSGTAVNPGAFGYEALWRDCAAHAARWDVHRIVVLAHSMGAHTAARLAESDPRVEQIWVAPVPAGRSAFASLYTAGHASQFHHVLFESPLSTTEHAAVEALSTDAWLDAARFEALEDVLGLPSRGGARVPRVWDYLREVAHPGYVLAPEDVVRLRGVLVQRDDVWVPLGVSQTFCAAARAPLHILSRGRGHAMSGGWSEILETVHSWLDDAGGTTHGVA